VSTCNTRTGCWSAPIFTTLPMVFLVFFFQRYIIKSVATTGGK
jgi:ABC-type glycerol-3-phosphate transport system permease component